MRQIRSFLLPDFVHSRDLVSTVVVIDVLRATTTICTALSEGALFVKPFLSVDETFQFADQNEDGTVLTGGERDGIKVPGFQLGNSPLEYSREKIENKIVAFTSTNGTKAMHKCASINNVVLGSFCNLSTVCSHIGQEDKVDLVCAGTNGEVTLEDSLFAGAVVNFFCEQSEPNLNDQAQICRSLWETGSNDLVQSLKKSQGGRNLLSLDKEEDIKFAARIDSLTMVPKLDIHAWKIEPA